LHILQVDGSGETHRQKGRSLLPPPDFFLLLMVFMQEPALQKGTIRDLIQLLKTRSIEPFAG
jgi:hypothetical protein